MIHLISIYIRIAKLVAFGDHGTHVIIGIGAFRHAILRNAIISGFPNQRKEFRVAMAFEWFALTLRLSNTTAVVRLGFAP